MVAPPKCVSPKHSGEDNALQVYIQTSKGWVCVPCFIELLASKQCFTLFKFCQNCYTVMTHDAKKCPSCNNPRVRGSCSQVWLRSRGLVDV